MTNPVISVYIDLENDGNFTGGDVSAYVITAGWQIGFESAFTSMARDNTASITFKNLDRRFSPEYASGPYFGKLTTGRTVKITATLSSITTVLYLGWIASISPTFGKFADRTCTIECTAWMERAQRAESLIDLQIEKTADEIIVAVLDGAAIYPPGFSGYWILGTSTIGVNTRVGSIASYFVAETGITTFAFAGDWEAGTSVYDAIVQTLEREGGRLFVARNGILYFYNRHHFLVDTAIDASFTNSMTDISYSYGTQVSNFVTAKYQPRSVSAPGQTLATLGKEVFVSSATTGEINYRFTGEAGETVAATAIITPVATTDYLANSLADGTGNNLTANVTASVSSSSATEATVYYVNSGPDAYILGTSKIRGTMLTAYQEQSYTAEDAISITAFGRLAYDYPGIQDTITDAQTVADFYLAILKNPVGLVESVTFAGKNSAIITSLLAQSIGSKIALSEFQTGIGGNWFIIGEAHEYSYDDYRITWTLEDAGASAYWTIGNAGFSEIGVTTNVGPL